MHITSCGNGVGWLVNLSETASEHHSSWWWSPRSNPNSIVLPHGLYLHSSELL